MTSEEIILNQPYDLSEPEPASLIESLRAFGYSLRTAIADLIDNSISAQAKNVWIHFEWKGADSWITIKDDGIGMSGDQLSIAMRPGSQNPLKKRSPEDLGRFGLGLKTASFSQCRSLTAISKTINGQVVYRCWDLDYIVQTGQWRLLKFVQPDPISYIDQIISDQGTIILWQKMDRVTGTSQSDDRKAYDRFTEAIDEVKEHLAMVFHRFLESSAGIKIWINNRPVEPWDPFLKKSGARELPVEKLFCHNNELTVTPYILPHHSKISREVQRRADGPNGWNAHQGFYVYRNKRLLVGGDWLGLGFQKEDHYKLARIQVDIPNTMDSEWQIDVKKSRARAPGYLRQDLRRIARIVREQASEVYRHRGKIIARQNSQNFVFLWQQRKRHGKVFYSINRDHPVVKHAYNCSSKEEIENLLSLLEESIPMAQILFTSANEPDSFGQPYEGAEPDALLYVLKSTFNVLLESGLSPQEAKTRLMSMDPFNFFPERVEQILSALEV